MSTRESKPVWSMIQTHNNKDDDQDLISYIDLLMEKVANYSLPIDLINIDLKIEGNKLVITKISNKDNSAEAMCSLDFFSNLTESTFLFSSRQFNLTSYGVVEGSSRKAQFRGFRVRSSYFIDDNRYVFNRFFDFTSKISLMFD